MKIIITEPEYFPDEFAKRLEKVGEVLARRMKYDELLTEVRDADALIIRVETKVDKRLIDTAEKLRIIASMTTGLNHIDVKQAELHGIKLISMPGYATSATAEYTMGLILSLARKIPWAFEHFKKERWERHKFLGSELSGKTLGVVGLGRIGSRVAKYANSFGMKVIFYDPYLDRKMLEGIVAEQTNSVEDLLQRSDIVTIHAFLSKETKKMIRGEQLKKMKGGSLIINASRGAVIDESDLVEALESGTIAGAALDVFEEEPLPPSHELVNYARNHDNLILTPHIAGSTKESVYTAAKFVTESILEELGSK